MRKWTLAALVCAWLAAGEWVEKIWVLAVGSYRLNIRASDQQVSLYDMLEGQGIAPPPLSMPPMHPRPQKPSAEDPKT